MGNQEARQNPERPGPSRRILVVDDNRDSATSLAMLLNVLGHTADTAFDGAEALQKASVYRHDVIFLDIGLPGMNGYDVCKSIRSQPWSHGITIVALTGWGQDADKRTSAAAGFSEHLVKPVTEADLSRVLTRSEDSTGVRKTGTVG